MTTLQAQITAEVARAKAAEAAETARAKAAEAAMSGSFTNLTTMVVNVQTDFANALDELDARLTKLEPPPYTFSDDFTGTTLDPTKWRVSNYGVTGSGRQCCGDAHANFADAVTVGGGYLHLGAKLINGVWHTGCIDTETIRAFGYGKYEARIKVPKGPGLWPAFWLYDKPSTPAGQEIDILEAGGTADKAMQGIHRFDNDPRTARDKAMTLSDDFHIFAADWRASSIQFSIDGVNNGTPIPVALTGQKMALILNLGMGNAAWSAIGSPDATTPNPSEMLVDWVRVS